MSGNVELQMTLKDAQLIVGLLNQARAIEKNENATRKVRNEASAWEKQLKKTEEAAQKAAAAETIWNAQLEKTAAAHRAIATAARDAFVNAQRAVQAKGADPFAAGLANMAPRVDHMALQREKTIEARRVANREKDSAIAKADEERFRAYEAANKKVQAELKKTEDAQARLRAETQRLVATPIERYNARMKELQPLLKGSKEDQELFNRAAAQAADDLEAEEKAAKSAFGSEAVGMVMQYASAAGLAATAIHQIGEALQFANEQREAGAQSLKSDMDVLRNLNEVSDSPEEYQKRVDQYNKLKTDFGLTREAAADLMFMGISTENEAAIEQFAGTKGAMRPELAMKVGSHLETLFKGQVNETEAANMMYFAAMKSRYDTEDFAPALPTAAGAAAFQGSSAAETLALQSVLSDVFKSPEQASERIQILANKLAIAENENLRGKGVLGAVDMLAGMSEGDRKEFLKTDTETNLAYQQIVANRDAIEARMRELEEVRKGAMGPDSLLSQRQRQFEATPAGRALLESQRAEQDKEGALRDQFGLEKLSANTEADRIEAEDARAGLPWYMRSARRKMADLAVWLGGDAESARTGAMGADMGLAAAIHPALGMLSIIKASLENIERTNAAMAQQGNGSAPRRTPDPAPPRR